MVGACFIVGAITQFLGIALGLAPWSALQLGALCGAWGMYCFARGR